MDVEPADGEGLVRVLVANDHPVVREGLTALLEVLADLTVVGAAADGDQLLRAVRRNSPDVVLLEVRLAGQDGLVLCRRVKLRHPDVGVLVFADQPGDDQVRQALAGGAGGVVLKTAPVAELLDAIRALAGGRRVVGFDLEPKQNAHGARRFRRQVEEQERKIREELRKEVPDEGLIDHWQKEIAGWNRQIDKLNKRIPPRSAFSRFAGRLAGAARRFGDAVAHLPTMLEPANCPRGGIARSR
ncbi:MAG: response regulator transcription factor [Actinobacteria bacterium]|nr:response regulator transcription factor [Actinomycetota bacterium]